ncbi:MAG: hypothetical protein HQ481_08965 [Alphaproteobacteria bacterium]|nr:hypothetical protein [Alphaproteobacteria bacterium]
MLSLLSTPTDATPTIREYLAGLALAFAVLLLRMPTALVEPALWPDDFNYLTHVYNYPGEPIWYYVNLAGTKAYVSLLPMLEAWAYVHLVPSYAWTPYLFVGSSVLLAAAAQALPLHPLSMAMLTTPTQRRLAYILLILLPVSTIGEVTTVAIQHVTFLMMAAWLAAMAVGRNDWLERCGPIGFGVYLLVLGVAIWSAPTGFVLLVAALPALLWAVLRGSGRSRAAMVLAATSVFGIAFIVFGVRPGPSFLYQGILAPLADGQLATGLLGGVELARLTVLKLADTVMLDLVIGSEAKLYLGRAVPGGYPLAYVLGGGLVVLAGGLLWRAGTLSGPTAPGRWAVLTIASLLVAINLAARWEPDNALAIEGFRYWRWRYFTVSQWLVAAVLAVPLATAMAGRHRVAAGAVVTAWLVALNLSNQPKYEEFFKHELAERPIVHYGQIKGGEVAFRAAATAKTMADMMAAETAIGPSEARALSIGPWGHAIMVRGN